MPLTLSGLLFARQAAWVTDRLVRGERLFVAAQRFVGWDALVKYQQDAAVLALLEIRQVLELQPLILDRVDLGDDPGVFAQPAGAASMPSRACFHRALYCGGAM
jgi:hypothetical protein